MFHLISAKWTIGYEGEIKTTEPWVYKLAEMDGNPKLSWVVFSVGCNELTNLVSDLFHENASFLLHLKLIVCLIATYSFINLLFIIIIFFVLGVTALVNLALTD